MRFQEFLIEHVAFLLSVINAAALAERVQTTVLIVDHDQIRILSGFQHALVRIAVDLFNVWVEDYDETVFVKLFQLIREILTRFFLK